MHCFASFKIVIVKPQPWSTLEYSATSAVVSVGEVAPVLTVKPQVHDDPSQAMAETPATSFAAHCTVTPAAQNFIFHFDERTGSAYVNGYPVFQIHDDGSIATLPAASMVTLFDAMVGLAVRKKISLACSIFAMWPDPAIAAKKASITIDITDEICWIPTTINAFKLSESDTPNEHKCRSACRNTDTCAFYKFEGGKCGFFRQHGTNQQSLTAKITNCTGENACIEIGGDFPSKHKFLAGHYCPIGDDAERHTVYEKYGLDEDLNMVLIKYLNNRDGNQGTCPNDPSIQPHGRYVLRRTSQNDFMEPESGFIDIRGKIEVFS